MGKTRYWTCSIEVLLEDGEELPDGCDSPPRQAAEQAIADHGAGKVVSNSSGWGELVDNKQ